MIIVGCGVDEQHGRAGDERMCVETQRTPLAESEKIRIVGKNVDDNVVVRDQPRLTFGIDFKAAARAIVEENVVEYLVVDAAVLEADGEATVARLDDGVAGEQIVLRAPLIAVAIVPTGDPARMVVIEQVVTERRLAHGSKIDRRAAGDAVVMDYVCLDDRILNDAVALRIARVWA